MVEQRPLVLPKVRETRTTGKGMRLESVSLIDPHFPVNLANAKQTQWSSVLSRSLFGFFRKHLV